MGARVSIQFRNKELPENYNKSVVLFAHWGGKEFVEEAKDYVKELKQTYQNSVTPLARLEPSIVIIDFLHKRVLTDYGDSHIEASYYLEKYEQDGDNSDYGHHIIDLT